MPNINLTKLSHRAANATKAVVATAAGAVATRAGAVDDTLKAAHERLAALHATYSELHSALKHQALNARKMAKTVRESSGPMLSLSHALSPETRRSVQTAMSVDAAIARSWDEYAALLEGELITPAKHECSAIFAEADAIWASYIGTVNELAARQGKERFLGPSKKETEGHMASLAERKATLETSKLPHLLSLAEAAEAAMSFLVERHRLTHAAHHRDAHAAATSAAGESASGEETSALVAATRAGWERLQHSSGSGAFESATAGRNSGTATAAAVAPPRSVFDSPLEALALRADAVSGVPLVAHGMIHRLLTGSTIGGNLFLESEGIFRIQADADDCDALRRQLDGGSAAALSAIASATDAHILATTLKQWLRRLPSPLIPPAAYRALVNLGQQSLQGGGARGRAGALPPALESSLPSLVRSLPQPNLLTLHALVELLEAVIARESINRMSASNLALVFAPTICRAEAATAASLAESAGLELAVEIPSAAHVLAELIAHRADCFPAIQSVVTPPSGTAAAAVSSGGGGGSNPFDVSDGGVGGGGEASRRKSKADPPNWWYSASGEQVGPVTGGRLAALLANGELNLTTWVFEGGSSDWQELSQVQNRLPVVHAVW